MHSLGDDLTRVKMDHHLLTAVCIIVFSFSIQFMVFPTYAELDGARTAERFTKVSLLYYGSVSLALSVASVISLLLFKDQINESQDLLLTNVSSTVKGPISALMRIFSCILFLINLPHFFLTMKQHVLVMIDELLHKSISNRLDSSRSSNNLLEERRVTSFLPQASRAE